MHCLFLWFVSSGLTSLPLLSSSSHLKKLDARDCDIQSLPHNLFHHKLEEIDVNGNKGDYDDDVYDNDNDDDNDDDSDNGKDFDDDSLSLTPVDQNYKLCIYQCLF